MRIVVIGPGALGCLLAATLGIPARPEAAPHQVWLLDHDAARARQLSETGLTLEEEGRTRHCPIQAVAAPDRLEAIDLILLCVKAKDFQAGLNRALAIATTRTLVVTLQNGIAHLEAIGQLPPATAIAVGVTAQGATLLGPGHVRHAGHGPTRLGFLRQHGTTATDRLAATAAALNSAGLETVVTTRILDQVWEKLLVNVGINALTVIHACLNGGLLEIPAARAQMAAAVREAAAVAAAMGIKLTAEPVLKTEAVCRATANNISSMRQDVMKKRRTEIDAINGAVVAAGQRLGLALPVNEALVRQVKKIEQGFF